MREPIQLNHSKSPSTIMWPRETEFIAPTGSPSWEYGYRPTLRTAQSVHHCKVYTSNLCLSIYICLSICDICFLVGISCEIDSMCMEIMEMMETVYACTLLPFYELHSMQHQSLNMPFPMLPSSTRNAFFTQWVDVGCSSVSNPA